LKKRIDESFEKKNLNKVNVADDFDDDEEILPQKTTQCEILEIKNNLQDQRDLIEALNAECEKIRNKMRYTTIAQIEKELNSKIEENIRIKTTVDVLNKRLFKERKMIHRKIT
jgi:hypothetical protein